jgi:NADH:ubiquinone oxidoreductase subunit E
MAQEMIKPAAISEKLEPEYSVIFSEFTGSEGELITILLRVQDKFGFISEKSVRRISRFLKISENQVFGVASFFPRFRFVEPGKKSIKVCMGTACHVHGGGLLADAVGWKLGIRIGQKTPDGQFDFQRINCLGCCTLAPVVRINEGIHGRMMVTKLKKIMEHRD